MAITSETTKVQYDGTGLSTSYPYIFKVFADTDLKVIDEITSTGVETVLTYAVDYTVTGAGVISGGNVVLAAVLQAGHRLTIKRDLDYTQPSQLPKSGDFQSETVELTMCDRLLMLSLQLKETISRIPQMPESFGGATPIFPEPSAGQALAWDATGTDLENYDLATIGALAYSTLSGLLLLETTVAGWLTRLNVSAFAQTILDDADAAAVLTTLGVTPFAQTILDDADMAAVRSTIGAIGIVPNGFYDDRVGRPYATGASTVQFGVGRLYTEASTASAVVLDFASGFVYSAGSLSTGEVFYFYVSTGSGDLTISQGNIICNTTPPTDWGVVGKFNAAQTAKYIGSIPVNAANTFRTTHLNPDGALIFDSFVSAANVTYNGFTDYDFSQYCPNVENTEVYGMTRILGGGKWIGRKNGSSGTGRVCIYEVTAATYNSSSWAVLVDASGIAEFDGGNTTTVRLVIHGYHEPR